MVTNEQQAIDLRNQIIAREQALSNLNLPKPNYSKTELRTGMMGRVQRRENLRTRTQVEKQKGIYKQKREAINQYLQQLEDYEQQPTVTEFGLPVAQLPSPVIPQVTFFGIPTLRKSRGQFKKQILRRRSK